MMDITVNGLKVLRDGTLVVSSSHPISFKINGMTFVFVFIQDESGAKDVKQVRDGNTMTTHLINFNNSLGSGLKEPTEMATLGTGEKLFFSFAVHSIGNTPKVFHYTWLLGAKQETIDGNE